MNASTDEELMLALVRAGQCGVKIVSIVLGAGMLPAHVYGVMDNLRMRSAICRFLQQSRVFYFRCDDTEKLYASSADWMNANLLRRVELDWPVPDPVLRQRIIDECLVAYLHVGLDSWDLQTGGTCMRAKPGDPAHSHGAQADPMARYSPPH